MSRTAAPIHLPGDVCDQLLGKMQIASGDGEIAQFGAKQIREFHHFDLRVPSGRLARHAITPRDHIGYSIKIPRQLYESRRDFEDDLPCQRLQSRRVAKELQAPK